MNLLSTAKFKTYTCLCILLSSTTSWSTIPNRPRNQRKTINPFSTTLPKELNQISGMSQDAASYSYQHHKLQDITEPASPNLQLQQPISKTSRDLIVLQTTPRNYISQKKKLLPDSKISHHKKANFFINYIFV